MEARGRTVQSVPAPLRATVPHASKGSDNGGDDDGDGDDGDDVDGKAPFAAEPSPPQAVRHSATNAAAFCGGALEGDGGAPP